MLKDAENEYFDSIHTTLDSYTKIISLKLNDYIHSLQVFYTDKIFDNPDSQKIFQFINEYAYKMPEDFFELYYVLPDGTIYTSDNFQTKLNPENHLGLREGNDIAVSGLRIHPRTGDKIFSIEKKDRAVNSVNHE